MSEFDQVIHPETEAYCSEHTTSPSPLLSRLERETYVHVLNPRMVSGAYQGKFLELISRMIVPEMVLELGTYTGYSAICLAQGLKAGGRLITLEHNPELEDRILRYIDEARLKDQIELRVGDAYETLLSMQEKNFDLIFLDADKAGYLKYYPLLVEKLRVGGWLLADNVLWSGKVWDDHCKDSDTKALRAFNDCVQQDERVENIILPFRDGMSLIRKIKD